MFIAGRLVQQSHLKCGYNMMNDAVWNNDTREINTIDVIYDAVDRMNGESDHVFQEIASLALEITGGKSCCLALFDEEKDAFHLRVVRYAGAHIHPGNHITPAINAMFTDVIRRQETVLATVDGVSVITAPLMIRSRAFGVLHVRGTKNKGPFTQNDLYYIKNLSSRASLNIENNILYESLYANIFDTFKSLITSIQARDHYTERHSAHVTELSVKTAKVLSCSDHQIQSLKIAAMLHDIGKIAIPDSILLKESSLTDDEYAIIRTHPVIGENILRKIMLMDTERAIIRHHHERWDGNGYPDGLAGEEIPYLSRIASVADSFDAMVSTRPYRQALTPTVAMKELIRNVNIQFDKSVVEAFESVAC